MRRATIIAGAASVLAAALACMLLIDVQLSADIQKMTGRILLGAALFGFVGTAMLKSREKSPQAGNVSRKLAGEACSDIGFDDVAANAAARRNLMQLCDYLKSPEKYADFGARMPRGVLLYGPPGTGKTLLARALAGEAGVPFFALSGSDFVEKYVGVGAGRVRSLFQKARKAGKCVIFIDEIDALGRRRDDQAADERDQTLNALLSEMSGFHTADGVIVIAATNRIEALDAALLRPGRFDRQIEVGLPDARERLSILRLHSKNKPLAGDVNLEALAAETVRFSGASLEALLNEAAIQAAERGAERIDAGDIRAAYVRSIAGEDRPAYASERELRMIAVHEAGHALVSRILQPTHRIARVSILPAARGAMGYNLTIPPEQTLLSARMLENQICVLLAGRAAEMRVFGEDGISTGASNDLKRAAEIAGMMLCELGMAGEPAVNQKAVGAACGGGVNLQADCRQLLNRLFERTGALIAEYEERLLELARELYRRESINGEELDAILNLSDESEEATA